MRISHSSDAGADQFQFAETLLDHLVALLFYCQFPASSQNLNIHIALVSVLGTILGRCLRLLNGLTALSSFRITVIISNCQSWRVSLIRTRTDKGSRSEIFDNFTKGHSVLASRNSAGGFSSEDSSILPSNFSLIPPKNVHS